MTRSKQREADSAVPTVNDLLEQRNRILGWLARLDEVDDAESARVVERVRADYRQRLEGVVGELSAHLEALRGELDGARERSAAAGERHAEADDALREARLRHRIGELDDGAWEARRGDLEAALAAASAERDAAVAEEERLSEVLAHIDSGVLVPPSPAEAPPVPPEPVAAAAVEVEAEPGIAYLPLALEEEPEEPGDDDLAFLEELDRAIAASAEASDPLEGAADEGEGEGDEEEIDTRPRKGMKCLECGYTNDVAAWYCGVCGVELP